MELGGGGSVGGSGGRAVSRTSPLYSSTTCAGATGTRSPAKERSQRAKASDAADAEAAEPRVGLDRLAQPVRRGRRAGAGPEGDGGFHRVAGAELPRLAGAGVALEVEAGGDLVVRGAGLLRVHLRVGDRGSAGSS